jgi:large subunit ribosomal protein L24
MNIVKNDNVKVIAGKYKNSTGKVLKVFPGTSRVIVEGVNIIKRHTRPSQQNQKGGIVEKEGSINASNVMVICPKCNRPTRIGKRILEDKSRVRVCKHSDCSEILSN